MSAIGLHAVMGDLFGTDLIFLQCELYKRDERFSV